MLRENYIRELYSARLIFDNEKLKKDKTKHRHKEVPTL